MPVPQKKPHGSGFSGAVDGCLLEGMMRYIYIYHKDVHDTQNMYIIYIYIFHMYLNTFHEEKCKVCDIEGGLCVFFFSVYSLPPGFFRHFQMWGSQQQKNDSDCQ